MNNVQMSEPRSEPLLFSSTLATVHVVIVVKRSRENYNYSNRPIFTSIAVARSVTPVLRLLGPIPTYLNCSKRISYTNFTHSQEAACFKEIRGDIASLKFHEISWFHHEL